MSQENTTKLRDLIRSDQNIYNAIYSMESYVFEKGLLSKEDLKTYVRLADKYDFEYINDYIEKCRERIDEIVEDESKLFNVQVYFWIKKWDDEKEKTIFRPIHTASLLDQICMVCMLTPLMYDDTSGVRKYSELTKLIPHNFYGNIPSTRMECLFEPWRYKYKEYNEQIVERSRQYKETHKYNTEVTLDIKNFFPSISPAFMFDYVCKQLSQVYTSDEDKETLHRVLTKLLFFYIRSDNLSGFMTDYYGESPVKQVSKTDLMNCGIPQGLPQSYFFGNLCMVEIYQAICSLEEFQQGNHLFYVDDSVFYIEHKFANDEEFDKLIERINQKLKPLGDKKIKSGLPEACLSFQNKLKYEIKYHDSGKSGYCSIDDTDTSLSTLVGLHKEMSSAGSFYSNVDEIEDIYSSEKLEHLDILATDEIRRIEAKDCADQYATRLKHLKRAKRYFLFRLKLLKMRIECGVKDEHIKKFWSHFGINKDSKETRNKCIAKWFETYDEDIFQTEARLMIANMPKCELDDFVTSLNELERQLAGVDKSDFLYLQHDFEASVVLRQLQPSPYAALERHLQFYLGKKTSLADVEKKGFLCKFIGLLDGIMNSSDGETAASPAGPAAIQPQQNGIMNSSDRESPKTEIVLPDYVLFVLKNSDEYVRRILNAYFSQITEVRPSDDRSFIKRSARTLSYMELRILARLRNRQFRYHEFTEAMHKIDAADLDNRMSVDMGLLEVVPRFISLVRNPDWVDSIILTHRVVKGLWVNGSKFLYSYTLHNEEHAVTLIKWCDRLVKAIDYLNIKQQDYHILFLACYLHDISMVIHPDLDFLGGDCCKTQTMIRQALDEWSIYKDKDLLEADDYKDIGRLLVKQFNSVFDYFEGMVRDGHAEDSSNRIRQWSETVLKHLDKLLLENVSEVSVSHGYGSAEVYGRKSNARNSVVSLKYMMILMRLADLFDVTNIRINYNLLRQNVQHMNDISTFHWVSHLITDEVLFFPQYKIESGEDATQMPLSKRKIQEYLNVNLMLNVKYLATVKSNCGLPCYLSKEDSPLRKKDCLPPRPLPSGYESYDYFSYSFEAGESPKPESCMLLCKWNRLKHDWLIKELKELQQYLNAVNSPMFESHIRLNVCYRDLYSLDGDLLGRTRDYIERI